MKGSAEVETMPPAALTYYGYADQNERDYKAFTDAVNAGRITALTGV